MEANFFENLQARKEHLKKFAAKSKDFGWIDEQRMSEIIEKLDNDTLTIGVIGQMKCGKSTFLNAFVFEDDVLPSATTPMTAALSVIKYGEQKKLVAEFYTRDEWEEQLMQSKRDLSEISNEIEQSKVKAAKELVAKSATLGGSVGEYLGKSQEDSFDNLIEYVGADGKYISITKSVTIYYPKEYLKGVEIVDTPGFNDPIVSREERTKEFLKRADVVLLMLYAGRPFDATDRTILFQNVRSCGIGKVIIGVNKYDIPYGSGETPEEIQAYVKDEIMKACADCNDSRLVDILQGTTPILLSANMALLSEMPMSKITSHEEYKTAWERSSDIFEISNQNQFREKSQIDHLSQAVKDLVEKEKGQILFAKPINSIIAAGNKKLEQAEKELKDCEAKIIVYSTPDDELEEKRENLGKAIKRIERKISSLEDTLDEEFEGILRKTRNDLEDIVDASVKRLNRIVDNWGVLQGYEKIEPEINNEIDKLQTRDLKRCMEEQQSYAQRKLRSALDDFFEEADEIIWKYLPDFDQKGFLSEVKREIKLSIDDDLFKVNPNEEKEEDNSFAGFVDEFLTGATYGLWTLGKRLFNHSEIASELKKIFGNIKSQFNANDYLQSILSAKKEIIDSIKAKYQDEFLSPIQTEFDELVNNANNKLSILEEASKSKEKLVVAIQDIKAQIAEINSAIF